MDGKDADQHDHGSEHLKRCERDYKETGNPLFAWEAWGVISHSRRSAVHDELEIPEWLAAYFDRVSNQLLGWKTERRKLRSGHWEAVPETKTLDRGEGCGAIGRALGFISGLAVTRDDWGGQFNPSEHLAIWMADQLYFSGRSVNAAAQLAENEKRASRSTAIRALKNSKTLALTEMKSRLAAAAEANTPDTEVVATYIAFCKRRARLRR